MVLMCYVPGGCCRVRKDVTSGGVRLRDWSLGRTGEVEGSVTHSKTPKTQDLFFLLVSLCPRTHPSLWNKDFTFLSYTRMTRVCPHHCVKQAKSVLTESDTSQLLVTI